MIVLDASAAIELLLAMSLGAQVTEVLADPDQVVVAPHLLDLEIMQVLRRLESSGALTRARASDAFHDFKQLDITRYAHDALADRVWQLRGHVTAYDAAYIALTETVDASLVTCDSKLAKAGGHYAQIHVIQ